MTWFKKEKQEKRLKVRVGERWLIRKNSNACGENIDDFVIREVSPDGEYIRIYKYGWQRVDETDFICKLSGSKDESIENTKRPYVPRDYPYNPTVEEEPTGDYRK